MINGEDSTRHRARSISQADPTSSRFHRCQPNFLQLLMKCKHVNSIQDNLLRQNPHFRACLQIFCKGLRNRFSRIQDGNCLYENISKHMEKEGAGYRTSAKSTRSYSSSTVRCLNFVIISFAVFHSFQ